MSTDDSPLAEPVKPLDPVLLRAARRALKAAPVESDGTKTWALYQFLMDAQDAWHEVGR